MKQEELQELIELYIRNQLKGDALHQFEKAMSQDEDLANEVRFARDLEDAFEETRLEKELGQQLQFLNKKYAAEYASAENSVSAGRVVPFYQRHWKVAATILLLIVGGFLIWNNVSTNPTDIYANYYEPYNPSFVRDTNQVEANYLKAITLYKAKKYNEAIPLLENIPDTISEQKIVLLLLGNAYLNDTPPALDKAILIFQNLSNDATHLYTETATWYLGLAHLKAGNRETAKGIFQKLANENIGKYASLSKEILSQWN